MNNQIYYLISQDFYNCELMDIINKNDVLSYIKDKNINAVEINVEEIDNLFEVINLENNVYKIICIHKQPKKQYQFKIDEIIYVSNGMISFYTKKINGEINEISVFPTKIVKKEEIILNNFYNLLK